MDIQRLHGPPYRTTLAPSLGKAADDHQACRSDGHESSDRKMRRCLVRRIQNKAVEVGTEGFQPTNGSEIAMKDRGAAEVRYHSMAGG